MLIDSIGRRGAPEPGGALGLLTDCHARIRRFARLAVGVVTLPDAPPGEVAEAARQVHRYFDIALPLHVADEEESLLPRLRGRDPALDAALQAMHAEHGRIDAMLEVLLDVYATLASVPERMPALAPLHAGPAAALEQLLSAHLAAEEQLVFPAMDSLLDAAARADIEAEIQKRRAVAYAR